MKYVKFIFTFLIVFALTGCVKYNMNMEVKEDKSVNLDLIYAIDYSIMDQFKNFETEEGEVDKEEVEEVDESDIEYEEEEEEAVSVDDYKFLEEKGFKVEEFKDEANGKKYTGIKISKIYKSIDDITKETEKTIDVNKVLGDKDSFDDSQFFSKKGNVYKASLLFDFTEDDKEAEGMNIGSMSDSFELKYTIKLPAKAKTNNATEVSEDGKTLTWKFKYGEKNMVEYSFALNNGLFGLDSNMVMYIGIGIGALLVVVVLVMVFSKKKKGNKEEHAETLETFDVPTENKAEAFDVPAENKEEIFEPVEEKVDAFEPVEEKVDAFEPVEVSETVETVEEVTVNDMQDVSEETPVEDNSTNN